MMGLSLIQKMIQIGHGAFVGSHMVIGKTVLNARCIGVTMQLLLFTGTGFPLGIEPCLRDLILHIFFLAPISIKLPLQ